MFKEISRYNSYETETVAINTSGEYELGDLEVNPRGEAGVEQKGSIKINLTGGAKLFV